MEGLHKKLSKIAKSLPCRLHFSSTQGACKAAAMAAIDPNPPSTPPPAVKRTGSLSKYSEPASLPLMDFSKENLFNGSPDRWPLPSLPIGSPSRTYGIPLVPAHGIAPQTIYPPPLARASSFESGDDTHFSQPSRRTDSREIDVKTVAGDGGVLNEPLPVTKTIAYRQRVTTEAAENLPQPQSARFSSVHIADLDTSGTHKSRLSLPHSRNTSGDSLGNISENGGHGQPLQFRHQPRDGSFDGRVVGSRRIRSQFRSSSSGSPPPPASSGGSSAPSNQHLGIPFQPRPTSAPSLEHGMFAHNRSPQLSPYSRAPSSNSRGSPDIRPLSYVDLLNVPYPQPPPAPTNLDNTHLRSAVGNSASLLSTKQTLDMYRANVKKTNDPTIQYEFAVFMINAAQEASSYGQEADSRPQSNQTSSGRDDSSVSSSLGSRAELLREARHILQRLSDRSYPFAQYYLADGYASGLFNKGVEDYDRAFPLFISASKHGHAEAGYRAALCYEFGWGTRKDPLKAAQFYRQSASKNHPGAMTRLGNACLQGDLGLVSRYREGLKWLKRAAESADYQYNSAPYELGVLHETGFGDDIFQDESYAAQLFTQSADLGHMEANYRLGDAYEHGKLVCPRDPALSVHFYTGAAQRGHPLAMMALCAWYMVGAEPVLEKDENEAYEWARKAADCGK